MTGCFPFSAFVAPDGVLYTRAGGQIAIEAVKIDSNTNRIIYTINGDSRDITDTLNSDEQQTLRQMAPSYQFHSIVAQNKSGIQPYQWVLLGGGMLLVVLLIMRRSD